MAIDMENRTSDTPSKPARVFFSSGTALEHLPDGYFLTDLSGRILDHNPAFARILNTGHGELRGKLLEEMEPHGYQKRVARDLRQVMDTGRGIRATQWRFRQSQSRPGLVEASVSPALDETRNIAGAMGIIRDGLAARLSEEQCREKIRSLSIQLGQMTRRLNTCIREMQQAEKTYHNFFNNAQVGLYKTSMEQDRVLDANEKLYEIFGYRPKEVDLADFKLQEVYVNPGQRRGYMKILSETGRIEGVETRFRKKDGSVFWVRFSSRAYPEQGWVEGVLEDISHQKRMEEALKKSEAKYKILYTESRRAEEIYRGLLNSSADAIIIYDLDGNVRYINPRFTEIFGWRPVQVLGKSIPFLPENLQAQQDEIISNLIENGKPSHGRITTRLTLDGRTLDVSQSASIFREPDGSAAGILMVLRDISETRRLETQLIQAQKMEAIGTLAGGIAHDFNNILQAIQGYTQLLLMSRPAEDKDAQKLVAIQNAAQRASNLTRRLLIFSRKMESELKVINLNQEVLAVVRLLERTIPKMIRIRCDMEDNLYRINGDPLQLEQVMMNMGVNARDAMPDGGVLVFETRNMAVDDAFARSRVGLSPGLYVRLRIQDTGIGMEKKVVEQIFEPFFTTKEVGKGTGLGLSMVYGAVKNHKGAVICESQPQKGTRFDIYFPALKTAPKPKADFNGANSYAPGGNETILIIDDEQSILELLENVLKNNGYTALTAENGETAVEVLKQDPAKIHLAILDLSMPGMGGIKCLAALRRISPNLKVIVSSGYSNLSPEKQSALATTSAVILKPYDLGRLLRTVRTALDA